MQLLRPLTDEQEDCFRWSLFRRVVAGSVLMLLAVTWKLWTPQTLFPQVPFFSILAYAPGWLDWIALATLIVGFVTVLLVPEHWRMGLSGGLSAGVVGFLLLTLLDQHRFQPWAYEAVLIFVVMLFAPRRQAIVLLRLLVVSIYFYSAVSKFDRTFLESTGIEFLAALLGLSNDSLQDWPATLRIATAALFPVGELLVAVGLYFRQTRRVALLLAIGMHVALLKIIGPWGLGHKPGVMLWNVQFILVDILLFYPWKQCSVSDQAPAWASGTTSPNASRLATVVVGLALLLPLGELAGIFDHWPAWSLYAPRSSRTSLFLRSDVAERLPAEIKQHIQWQEDGPWHYLDMSGWSLEAVNAPIYPQDRYQLGVALAVAARFQCAGAMKIVVRSAANRFTGKRAEKTYAAAWQLEAARARFLLGTEPRPLFLPSADEVAP